MQLASQHLEAIVFMALHVAVVAGVGVRVVLARHTPGSSFAWLLLTAGLPVIGVIGYALIGERPIGKRRADFARSFYAGLPAAVDALSREERADPAALPAPWDGLARLASRSTGMPLMARSSFELQSGAERTLRSILADVNGARSSVEMEFYIWNAGGAGCHSRDLVGSAAGPSLPTPACGTS